MDYKKEIKKTGLTIGKVAELVGISQVLLSYYINGKKNMPLHIQDRLKKIIAKYSNIEI